jgi:hypothetical protein
LRLTMVISGATSLRRTRDAVLEAAQRALKDCLTHLLSTASSAAASFFGPADYRSSDPSDGTITFQESTMDDWPFMTHRAKRVRSRT